jgi:glyoxylase-like metal-dependent hydrolase (beta-lactamase superfamily II)
VSAIRLDELTSLILAPNPSAMTLEGTNTYLVGATDSGEIMVVDPGPDHPDHRAAIDAAVRERGAAVAAVILTHHHVDHAEAAGWAQLWDAPLWAFAPPLVPGNARALTDGATIRAGGTTIEALHTPGHASDHLCLRVRDSGAVLTGDHVLGRGTSVVAWPDGDMTAYVASLRRLATVPATVLYPGHGPVLHDPGRAIADYLAHRELREGQVLAALAAGDRTPGEIVARVYADVDAALHPAAERSVRAHLDKLQGEGRALQREGIWR